MSYFENNVDPDQLASDIMITVHTVFYPHDEFILTLNSETTLMQSLYKAMFGDYRIGPCNK